MLDGKGLCMSKEAETTPIASSDRMNYRLGWNDALEEVIEYMQTHSIGYGCPGSTFIHETSDRSVGSDRFIWIEEFEKWKRQ